MYGFKISQLRIYSISTILLLQLNSYIICHAHCISWFELCKWLFKIKFYFDKENIIVSLVQTMN